MLWCYFYVTFALCRRKSVCRLSVVRRVARILLMEGGHPWVLDKLSSYLNPIFRLKFFLTCCLQWYIIGEFSWNQNQTWQFTIDYVPWIFFRSDVRGTSIPCPPSGYATVCCLWRSCAVATQSVELFANIFAPSIETRAVSIKIWGGNRRDSTLKCQSYFCFE